MSQKWIQPGLPETDAPDKTARVLVPTEPEPPDPRAPLGRGAVIDALINLRDATGHFGRCAHGMGLGFHRGGIDCPGGCNGTGMICSPRCADANRALGYMPPIKR